MAGGHSVEPRIRCGLRARCGRGEPGVAHQLHADEFLVYAYLQVGEDEKARELAAKMPGISTQMAAMPGMDDMKDAGPVLR